MTGYGKGVAESELIRITAEVKSVNGKALRIRYSLPRLFNPLINDVKGKVEEFVKRGEVELYVSYKLSPNFKVPVEVNYQEALALVEAARRISALSGVNVSVSLKELLSFPEVVSREEVEPSPFKGTLIEALTEAL